MILKVFVAIKEENLPAFLRKFINGCFDCPRKFGFHQEIRGNIFGELQQVFNFEDIGIKFPVVAKVVLAAIENNGGKVGFHRTVGINAFPFFP